MSRFKPFLRLSYRLFINRWCHPSDYRRLQLEALGAGVRSGSVGWRCKGHSENRSMSLLETCANNVLRVRQRWFALTLPSANRIRMSNSRNRLSARNRPVPWILAQNLHDFIEWTERNRDGDPGCDTQKKKKKRCNSSHCVVFQTVCESSSQISSSSRKSKNRLDFSDRRMCAENVRFRWS